MTNRFEIDDDGNADHADIVVCARLTSPLMMPDNKIGFCAECGEAIQYRPHVPKSPRKMCMECVVPLATKLAAKGKLTSIITPTTVAELKAHLRKKNAN